jgi:hypothetical protein
MKKFIVTEEEKHRIISLHKKLFSEERRDIDPNKTYELLSVQSELDEDPSTSTSTGTSTDPKETEGQVSTDFFEENKIYEFPSEKMGSSSQGPNCPPETDTEITKQFEDDNLLLKYPNDKIYRYKKIGEDWFAKNINNKKVFNITKCGYTSSVEKLNKEFPNKVETTTPSETEKTTSNTRGAEAAVQQYFDKKFPTTLPK